MPSRVTGVIDAPGTSVVLHEDANVVLHDVTFAAKPSTGCPAAASGWELVDVDEWWDRTVTDFETEGIDVYEDDGVTFTAEFDEFVAGFGFGDGAGLEDFVRVEQWDGIDKNTNELVCMKDWPDTLGTPAYFFGGVDDQSSSPAG